MTEHIRDDSNIVALFRDWVTEAKRAEALPDHEDGKFVETVDRENAIRHAIADMRSIGPVGLAIKAYVLMHLDAGIAVAGEPVVVQRCTDADARDHLDAHVWNSILDDIIRFAPELAPFVKGPPDEQPCADGDAPRSPGDELGFGDYVPPGR